MTSWFNSLNLNPRSGPGIGVLIGAFILVNVWFVWPHFGDWAKNAKNAEDYRAEGQALPDRGE